MGRLLGMHERSTMGEAQTLTSSGTSQRFTLVANAQSSEPKKFLVLSTAKVYLRQGDSTVVATQGDPSGWLPANTPLLITVESVNDAYLAIIMPSGGSAGDVTVTENGSATPGA